MKQIFTYIAITAFILLLVNACSHKKSNKRNTDKHISITGTRFIDRSGRQILFNGINLVNKNPSENYIYNNSEEIFKKFKKWGYNIVRLGIIWDGLEPKPGVYNEEYLQEIDKQIEYAKENGLYVFLDMHQDLYSVKYSDGAPVWATLDEHKPHVTGEIWSDAYLISPAVQTAWDNFWKNAPASDGTGLQDHYAKAWQHVAKRYAGNNTVIGYDMMNEPFLGSAVQQFMPVFFSAFAEIMEQETGKKYSVEEIAGIYSDQNARYKALQLLETKEKYGKVMDAVYDLNAKFEKEKLQPFYQKVTDAIREIDKKKIIFFNHSYFCNSGVRTALEPVKGADGKRDPLTAYAAHGYDLLVDTRNMGNSSVERLSMIFERINESGNRMNVPVLIGEWGALGSDSSSMTELAYENLHLIEKYKFSNTFWAYFKGIEKRKWLKAIVRPYPLSIAGELISYHFDENTGDFTCEWKENVKQTRPTEIFIPDISSIDIEKLMISPQGNGVIVEPLDQGNGGYILITPSGKDTERKIQFNIDNKEHLTISLISG
jgi:endoglycosylceramidase